MNTHQIDQKELAATLADGTYLVRRIGAGDPVAMVSSVRSTAPKWVSERMAEMDAFTSEIVR